MLRTLLARLAPLALAMACAHCGGGDGAGTSDQTGDVAAAPPGSPVPIPPLGDTPLDGGDAGALEPHDAATPSYDASSWMGALPDSDSLTALTIPGTHESCARHEPVPGTAQCQTLSLAEQLAAGVRYFDVRCRHFNDTFQIHHGPIFQQMTFDEVLAATGAFMKAHPTETILMSVKEEYTASGNTRTFEQTFDAYVKKAPSSWSLGTAVPALSDARGKIVLVRRFAATGPKGIDATKWADKATFTVDGPPRLRVQDEYEVSDNAAKWTAITALFGEALRGDAATLYLDYTSGYAPLLLGVPSIGDVSNSINPKLQAYFSDPAHGKGRYGVLAMDFVDATRAGLVLKKNF